MATSPLVPGRLPVAIEDHAYQIEPSGFRRETVQVLRQQADQSSEPGEQSLNPAGLWRRSQESWHHGAGQDFLDGKTEEAADPHRFRSSKGVDVWTRGQVSLLHPTLKAWTTAGTNLYLAVAQTTAGVFGLYLSDGTEVYFNALPFGLFNTFASQIGTGWSATNATIAQGVSPVSNPARFTVTATGAGAVTFTSPTGLSGVPVEPGREYAFMHQTVAITGGSKTPQVSVTWYDAAGATISSTAPFGASNPAFTTAVAPATAAFASLTGSYTTNFAAAEVKEVTASIAPYEAVSTVGYADAWGMANINAGQAAQTVQSIATDGMNVWAALGTSGLHRTAAGSSSSTADAPAAPGSGQISLVGHANGFLFAAGSAGVSATRQNTLWRVQDELGTPSLVVIKTHPNTNFVWTGISAGRSCVYAFGNCGGNGEIYKIAFDTTTGTPATAASPATMLPDGETIHALTFYAGGIIMGTGKGVRLGQADGAGNIDYGPLIDTDWPVRCLEPQGRFCWFGWTEYDSSTSGLGRVDLGYFTDTLTPAWATDLMTADPTEEDVVACVTFAPYGYTADQRPPVRVFTVAGQGVYIEDPAARESQGRLVCGTVRFNTSEPKLPRSLDLRHHALPSGGSIMAFVENDSDGNPGLVGTSSVAGSYGPAAPLTGFTNTPLEAMELSFTLNRPDPDGTDFSLTPELTRWTAKVLPTPSTIDEVFTIPIILAREVEDSNGANYPMDVDAEVAYLKGLERSRALVTLQLGDESHTCYLSASEFQGKQWGPGRKFMEGLFVAQFQTVRG